MNLVPAERALLERFKGKPFALVGVNSDPLKTDLRAAVKQHQITWRSFKDKQPGKPRIDATYKVRSWPTLYLIDQAGVIRARWPGTPSLKAVEREIDRLLAQE
jgi:hypothetical protein